jgi:flagellar assembly protein FliH
MLSSSRIVFAEDLGVATPWRPGALEGERRAGAERRAAPERRTDARPAGPSYEDGLRDGYARGLEEARLQGEAARRAEIEAIAQRGDALVAALTEQLATLQTTLSGELVALGVEIARSAFGAALRVRDDAVVPAVNAALAAIVDERARPILRVHPDDALLLGEQLGPLLEARGAQLVPDASVLPGGCRVETPRQAVDATVQTRWRTALAALGRDDSWIEA